MKYGTESLSDTELFALILGDKHRAESFFSTYGNLTGIVKEVNELKYNGSTESEAVKIKAMAELSARIYYAKEFSENIQLTSPEDVNAYFAPKLRHLTKENFLVGFLDNIKNLKGFYRISTGGKTATIVDTAEVMKQAVINDANSIVLVHNHPSGHEKASSADIQLTKRIAECGKLFGIPVEDHVIIAGYSFVSMRSEGLF